MDVTGRRFMLSAIALLRQGNWKWSARGRWPFLLAGGPAVASSERLLDRFSAGWRRFLTLQIDVHGRREPMCSWWRKLAVLAWDAGQANTMLTAEAILAGPGWPCCPFAQRQWASYG